MTREKALILALKIIDTCRKYGEDGRCLDCPYSYNNDCIISPGDVIPTEWPIVENLKYNRKGEKQ